MPVFGGGARQDSMVRVEATLGKLTDQVGVFQTELTRIKSAQEDQQRQIFQIETGTKSTLDEIKEMVAAQTAKMDERVTSIHTTMEDRARPKWGFWISTISLLATVLGSVIWVGVYFVNVNIRDETSPLEHKVAQLEQLTSDHRELEDRTLASRNADAKSEQDRAELNRRVAVTENELNQLKNEMAVRFAAAATAAVEVETQFKDLRGMTHYLWRDVEGKDYPIIPRETPSLMGAIGGPRS